MMKTIRVSANIYPDFPGWNELLSFFEARITLFLLLLAGVFVLLSNSMVIRVDTPRLETNSFLYGRNALPYPAHEESVQTCSNESERIGRVIVRSCKYVN